MGGKTYDDVTAFHGHVCPGSALGYRVAMKAMEWLDANRALDEEIVAVVENDSCAVDAVQVVTGCTFGKGNLVYRDTGKRVYTFFNRATGSGIRIVEDYRGFDTDEFAALRKKLGDGSATDEDRELFRNFRLKRIDDILTIPYEDFLSWGDPVGELPPKAQIHETLVCDECGEKMMSTRAVRKDGKVFCADCAGK